MSLGNKMRNRLIEKVIPVAILSAILLPALDQNAMARSPSSLHELTLQQAVGISVETYPEHGIAADNRRATDEELRQAEALYLPSVDVRVDSGYEHTRNPTLQFLSSSGAENLWRYNSGLTLTQMLFDGGAARHENLRQQARVLSASHRVREAAELQGLAAVESYLEVARQRRLLKIARENIAQHRKILGKIADSTRSGKTTAADEEQADARLAAARAEEENVKEALGRAEGDFVRDIGREPEKLGPPPAAPADALEKNLEEEVKVTLAQNPTIHISNADFQVAQEEYDATGAALYPKFDFQLQGQDGYNIGGEPGRNVDATALVVMNWNLYRGGADIAKRREFINREAQAKEERAKTARGVEDDGRKTWAGREAARARARDFAAQAANNVKVVAAYKDQFDLNRRTLLDVLDSQNELFVSRANAVNAQYLEIFAVYRLLALKGDLLRTLNIPVPREADPEKM
jgi:outer membrane protein, adhesin transport system